MLKSFLVALVAACVVLSGCTANSRNPHRREYQANKTVGQSIDDGVIIAEVNAKLLAEKNFPSAHVKVNSNKGAVYLHGLVSSTRQKNRASEIAWSVKGVRDVTNHIEVGK